MSQASHAPRLLSRVLLCGALCAPGAHALDPSTTPELARLAECNRIAGKTTGAKREILIAGCMERIDGDGPTQQTLDAMPVTPVAGAPATPAPGGLPGQETILGCAQRVRDLAGEARSRALKACLAGESPRADAHAAACEAQARTQPGAERASFVAACLSGKGTPPVAATQSGAAAPAASEQRRRAVCNVLAHDKQGEARKAYIAACVAGQR